MIKQEDKVLSNDVRPARRSETQYAINQAGMQRPSVPNTAGMNSQQKAVAMNEWRIDKAKYALYKAQKQNESKTIKAKDIIGIRKQEIADAKEAKAQSILEAKQAQQMEQNAVDASANRSIEEAVGRVASKVQSLEGRVEEIETGLSEPDIPTIPFQVQDSIKVDTDFLLSSYTRSIYLYNNKYAGLYGFYDYANQQTYDPYDGILVRDKNSPYTLKYVDAYLFGGGNIYSTPTPHRWNCEASDDNTIVEFTTGGTITCKDRYIDLDISATKALPATNDTHKLFAVIDDNQATTTIDGGRLYWEEELGGISNLTANVIPIASFYGSGEAPDITWVKQEQFLLSDWSSHEDRHSMKFLLDSLDEMGLGRYKVLPTWIAYNGAELKVDEIVVGANAAVYLIIESDEAGNLMGARYSEIAVDNDYTHKCTFVGVAGQKETVEYMPSWGDATKCDSRISTPYQQSIDFYDNEFPLWQIYGFTEGTASVMKVNSSIGDDVSNKMMFRENLVGSIPMVKYATSESAFDWLIYDNQKKWPLDKLDIIIPEPTDWGAVYDYMYEIAEGTSYEAIYHMYDNGIYWWKQGDSYDNTCWGRSIGSSDKTLAIDLEFRNLIAGGVISVDWDGRSLSDSGEDTSVDWQNKLLYYTGATNVSVDWETAKLKDGSGFNSASWNSRMLYDSDGSTVSADWNDRAMYDQSTNLASNWDSRQLYDSTEGSSVNWEDRRLYDSSDVVSADWEERKLSDASSVQSMSWKDRLLYDNSGNTIFNFNTQAMYVTNTTDATDVGVQLNLLLQRLRDYGLIQPTP